MQDPQAIQSASHGGKLYLSSNRFPRLSDTIRGHVSTMTHLEYLHQDESSGFSAVGMRQVYRLRGLVELFVRGAAVTDKALEGIIALKSLERLFLSETDVSDEGLRHLIGLTSVRELFLSECWRVTSAGMVHVGKLRSLRMVGLRDTSVKDDGLRQLSSLTRLEMLDPSEGDCVRGQEQLRRRFGIVDQ
ncbi:unnamed protein product [Closterium sp. NIES-54]